MRKILLLGATVSALLTISQAAQADFIFAGSGSSGTLASASETWLVTGTDIAPAGDFGWGSPGVDAATTTYGEAVTATNFEIDFSDSGFLIDPAQIVVGDAAHCAGTETGGTTFCGGNYSAPWTAVATGPSSIAFFAPAGDPLHPGDSYFVNIFLEVPAAGVPNEVTFTGAWTTGPITTPEPATLALFGAGLAGLGAIRRRRKPKA